MKNKWFTYIHIAEEENYIQSSGMSFNEFFNGVREKPHNLLILNGYPEDAALDRKHGLEYIPFEKIMAFVDTNVYNFGDFCWIDFADTERLASMPDEQLAELLFFAHKAKPLKSFCFNSLKNKYAYYSHDDDWYVRVYAKDPMFYLPVIEHKILKELKGRKKSIEPLPIDLLKQIYDIAKDGAVIDFENSYSTGVRVYKIGAIADMDSIHKELDKHRQNLNGLCLDYNPSSKKWRTF